jgi:hypothetical protein
VKRDDAFENQQIDLRISGRQRMTRKIRNLSLARLVRLRKEAVRLKDSGLDYIQIGRELDITTIAARDLCMQHQQPAKRLLGLSDVPRLPVCCLEPI